ncbi:MAG: glycosyltransferase family 4 protein [Planctomycetia bacterium]|jgi:glycosyltransferase involved in cell wall biosynthesis
MNIAFITPHFWPWFDRAGRVVGQMAVELLDRGHRPTILSRRAVETWPELIYYQGVPTVRFCVPLSPKRSEERCYQKQLARWLAAHRDELDVICVSGLGEDAETAIRAVGKNCPVVLRAERAGRMGDCLRQIETRRARRIKKTCMKAAAMIGTSPTSHAELIAAGYPRDRVVEIPNGAALRPHRTPDVQLAARQVLVDADPGLMALEDGVKVALYVGRLTDHRRVELLVHAWRDVSARHPHARLWIVGTGPALATLHRLIDRYHLAGSIQTPGVFDEPEILYDAADLYLQPSTDDDLSGSVLEALVAELPIITTDTSTHRQLLADCDTLIPGRGLAPTVVQNWSAAIDHTFTDPPTVTRPTAPTHSIHRTAENHLQLFGSL